MATNKLIHNMISIAAVSDLHFKPSDTGSVKARFQGLSDVADLLLLPGDLIDSGTAEDAQLFVAELADVGIPMVAVLGNHEYAARQLDDVMNIYRQSGIRLLDGTTTDFVIKGESLGILGTKGARGGFGANALEATGESEVDLWLDTARNEAARIEAGLGSLITDDRLVLLHFSPIRETVEGEALEQIPFYGSSILCEPVDRLGADLVVHGHSHHGMHRSVTSTGIPVYNVAAKVIPAPYVILELGQ
jgi:Icc-related predicted phosphoesterase